MSAAITARLEDLTVSEINVRKSQDEEGDETTIADLADNIRINGLINPLTVRALGGNKYEVIAGQRRLKALRLIEAREAPCTVVDVTDRQAEILSLTENLQRADMKQVDKIAAIKRLLDCYDGDMDKTATVIGLKKPTLRKYMAASTLTADVLERMDAQGDLKLTVETAVQLARMNLAPEQQQTALQQLTGLNSTGQVQALRTWASEGVDTADLKDIVEEQAIHQNAIKLAPTTPWVYDSNGDCFVIPEHLYTDVYQFIRRKL